MTLRQIHKEAGVTYTESLIGMAVSALALAVLCFGLAIVF